MELTYRDTTRKQSGDYMYFNKILKFLFHSHNRLQCPIDETNIPHECWPGQCESCYRYDCKSPRDSAGPQCRDNMSEQMK